MFRNNLILVLRRLKKERLYTFVNIFGLTIGLTAFLLIALYIKDELSFDHHIPQKENTYRIVAEHKEWGARGRIASNYIEILEERIPQIMDYSRLSGYGGPQLLTVNERSLYTSEILRVDPNFFEYFNFHLIGAAPNSVLKNSGNVVITTTLAKRLFGEENPIGKSIRLNKKETVFVTALAEPAEKNSTIQFEMLKFDEGYFSNAFDESGGQTVITYVTLSDSFVAEEVAGMINKSKTVPVYSRFLEDDTFGLLPFEHQRLKAAYKVDAFETNSMSYIILFSAIGFVVLMLAIINYVNLVTAQAVKRTKEVGLRKVIGATRGQLVAYQFAESITITILSFVLSFSIAERILPTMNGMLNKDLKLEYFSFDFLFWVLVLGVLIGLISGAYPAYYITRFSPLALMRKASGRSGTGMLRKFLVLFQFITSGVLLIVLVLISSQMSFLKNKDLGFKSDFLVSVPLYKDSTQLFQTVKNEIETISGLESVSLNGFRMGVRSQTSISDNWDRKRENRQSSGVGLVYADKDFLQTAQIKVLWAAETFEAGQFDDEQIMINETLAKKFGFLDNPSGRRLYGYNDKIGKRLVAIVEDFHISSMKEEVAPTIIKYLNDWGTRNVLLRIAKEGQKETLTNVGTVYEKIFERPFEYFYLDDQVKAFYKKEEGQFKLFKVFATLAISISLLGLVALTIFTLEQRRKEVSIRKVLGASMRRLILMLNKEYSILVVIAFLVASPIAYYAMEGWLDEFKYRITITPLLFIGAFLGFLTLSWLVTLFQSLKISGENPADILREE